MESESIFSPFEPGLAISTGVIFNRKQYCPVNTIWSSLLMTQRRIEGLSVGQHQLASLFMTGSLTVDHQPVNNYTATWDTDVVLKYLTALADNQELSLSTPTH